MIQQATKRSVGVMMSALALLGACGDAGEEDTAQSDTMLRESADDLPPPCTTADCFSEFPIQLEARAAWPIGAYEVSVSVDGAEPESCLIELGGPPRRSAADFCSAKLFSVVYVTQGERSSTSNRTGGPSEHDLAGEASGQAITSIIIEQGDHVELVITGPDGILTEGSFTPAWGDYFYPNGPQCGPRCRSAQAQPLVLELLTALSG